MKKHKIIITMLYVLLVAVFLSHFSRASAETSNKVVAIVNNDVITLHELNEKIRQVTGSEPRHLRIQDENKFHETQRQVLDVMIAEKVTKAKLKEMGIIVTSSEVDRFIENLKKMNRWSQEQFITGLKRQGISYELFREQIKSQIEQARIVGIEVKSRIIIREEQIKEYYEKHKEQFKTDGSVRLAAIVLKHEGSGNPDRSGQLFHKAKELLSRIKQGDDFGVLAREYSQGPGAQEGGDLGDFKTSQLDPELAKTISHMSPGDVSEPIIRPSAIQIIKLVEKKEMKQKPFNEVRESIVMLLYQREMEKRYSSWIKELKEKAYTKTFL